MMDTSEIKVDVVVYRVQLRLLKLHLAMCTGRPVLQYFTNVYSSVTKTHAYCNSLDPQANFWCYGVIEPTSALLK